MKYNDSETLKLIKERKENSSKGDFGLLLTLCGSENMTGAAYLSATAALRSGVGLLRFCANQATLEKMQRVLFEPIFQPLESISFEKATAFLCGCGIGRDYDDRLESILTSSPVPTIIDADGINFIAMHKDVLGKLKNPIILTPHPGEMSRLIGSDIAFVQSNRVNLASNFAKEHNLHLILKGKDSVIACPNGDVFINTTGSSALAKGGSGDVLAGVIASLVAQGYEIESACRLGVYIHGLAGDRLALRLGKSGVLPSDLPMEIGRILG